MDIITAKALIQTLNSIEVKGKENMEALLGCIWTLETEVKELTIQEQAARTMAAMNPAPAENADGGVTDD